MISKFINVLACVDKDIAFKSIGVALRLLHSQWKMHHCDVLCLVISLCSLQAYNYAEHLYNILLFLRTSPDSTSPPTHFTRAPPSHAKNRYLNSRLMIFHASELATELFDEVQSPRCMFAISIVTASLQSYQRGRVTSWSRAWYYAIKNGV